MPTETQNCPCGNEQSITTCCLPFIQGKKEPETAEQLLRARYTAFTRADVDYIVKSHHSKTVKDVNRDEIEKWAKESEWLGLAVLQKEAGEAKDEQGRIVFHAQYNSEGKHNDHHEMSMFEKEGGKWKFLDAQALQVGPIVRTEPKIGRNDPCKCGSGKKYKKCHGQAQ